MAVMQKRWPWMAATLVLVAGGFVWSMWPDHSKGEDEAQVRAEPRAREALLNPDRPSTPPPPDMKPATVVEPSAPQDIGRIKDEAYAKALEEGAERPGEVAFRATIDAFMAYNAAFAEAQARQEGVTVAEVHELTYFGFKVLETQRWPEVEELVEAPLSAEQRENAEALMHDTNKEFKDEIRRLVDEGASEEERWALIEDVQDRYMGQYYEITGMDADKLDELLAGDPSRRFAPADTPPPAPEDIEPAPAPPPVEPRPSHG
ncbi:hypothetical protein G6O69_17605 [Pseudenhygromyxa sp. WMMC2535]|uniref:hypothetical protein n=1 Tax=Pseudenhygromyxa sp. WMMC2535 TaxID=2712867 RepID=UPI001595C549|nr:hypothetical protein [Pseudenhygromyxa sp. WMMC2535]NVB39663.1 hypothetical protein [Pseudenhygromyxa sp. WMMC2535]